MVRKIHLLLSIFRTCFLEIKSVLQNMAHELILLYHIYKLAY